MHNIDTELKRTDCWRSQEQRVSPGGLIFFDIYWLAYYSAWCGASHRMLLIHSKVAYWHSHGVR